MTKIKVCGVTNVEDATWAANLGANYIGVNFYKKSPRKVSVNMAKEILAKMPPFIKVVAVFVDEDINTLKKVLTDTGIKSVQLHGNEDTAYIEELKKGGFEVFKAIRIKDEASIEDVRKYAPVADHIVLDAYKEDVPGGTGEVFDWELASKVRDAGVKFFLGGGLNPENVTDAVEGVIPFGVDVASGIERTPKKKDYEKMKDFIIKAKNL